MKNVGRGVARSSLRSQNVQSTVRSNTLPMGCSNTAPHCVAELISKSKVVTTDGRGTLFQIMRSKKCMFL